MPKLRRTSALFAAAALAAAGTTGTTATAAEAETSSVKARNKAIARPMVAQRGWSRAQFRCLERLWTRESNWHHRAGNRSSGAYGIPQAVPAHKMSTHGRDWRTNPRTQIAWGLSYIKQRYGTPCGAWSQFLARGWY
ncbi:transglycosylase SLT domain-containing protein [Nonomuraea sp. NPDC050310]|uniref:aggregation-promoting factor C-terminal-like domain-containing protein n=1 Tax=unclassified Nonomuraea TaxID=2593643 RepID=UPI0033C2694B